MNLTPSQFKRALALIQATDADERRINQLGRLITAAETAANANQAARSALTDFSNFPDRLAGLTDLYRRADPQLRQFMQFSYNFLLLEMREGLQPGTKPRKVDFHALSVAARPYLAAPYLGIHVGSFPSLCLRRSNPTRGILVYIHTGGPADPELWQPHLPKLSDWLGGHWSITNAAATTITLTRREPLPQTIPYARAQLATGQLFVGIDVVTHRPLHIPFANLSAGTYIPGASGTGKTSAVHILLKSLFDNLALFSNVYLVDGKDGVAMARYENLHPKIKVLYDEPDVWQLTTDLAGLMRTRNAAQRQAGIDKATKDFVAVVIDELPTYTAKPANDAKKEHAVFLDNLNKLAMRGRSAGIRLFVITQSPVAEQIPVTLRANCANTIAFRLPETSHATALFGALDGLPDPRKLPTGQAILRQGETGTIHHVQFPFAPLWNPRRPS